MDVKTAIQRRDQLKVELGVLSNQKTQILSDLKARFGTDDIPTLVNLRTAKTAELETAKTRIATLERELDEIFAGAK